MADRVARLLRAQTELLANISHELRTPLARIRVALDIAAEGDAAGARRQVLEIEEDLAEIERLVDDILTASRLEVGRDTAGQPPLRLEAIPAEGLLEKAATRFRTAYPSRTLQVSTEGRLPQVEVDPALLRRALDNVLDNAGKYSEPPSPVALSARAEEGRLAIEVRDFGIGIEPVDLGNVFTPFFRTDRSRARKTGGVGLGLPLAKRIVEAHGGSIAIQSRPSAGTTVRITIPPARAA
jgi:signal transduction histidine kinase